MPIVLKNKDKNLESESSDHEGEDENITLEARNISHSFWQKKGFLSRQDKFWAVSDLSFSLKAGTTLGLIGESGCGKSTLGRILCGLLPSSQGDVLIKGKNLYNKSFHQKAGQDYAAFRKSLGQTVQMVFQDPNSSLNPRMRVLETVSEPLVCLRKDLNKDEIKAKALLLLQKLGIAEDQAEAFPHAFSGGQKQRIAIARALIADPEILICDEPSSSLDSSVQAQILNLLDSMQKSLGLSYIFISHDLAVVRHMSDSVLVMYAGYIVEKGLAFELFSNPLHPYTQLLLDSVPSFAFLETASKHGGMSKSVAEKVRNLSDLKGCPFAPRCPKVMKKCWETLPDLKNLANTEGKDRAVRCFLI